jgi:hypothetical protein
LATRHGEETRVTGDPHGVSRIDLTMGHPKKHHYVPQFLLRNFVAAGGTRLYVFDKQTDRVFPASVADVAAENRLYEFSLGDVTATIEPSLADFESKAADVLRDLLSNDNLADLTVYQRVVLSGLVAQLLLRSPQQRAMMRHMNAELRQRVAAMGTDPDLLPQLKVFNDNEEKLYTARVLPDLMKQFIPVIAEKAWILHSVSKNETLYVSDNPVAMHNEMDFGLCGNLGLAVEGIQVFLPISSKRCLAMYCPSLSSSLQKASIESINSLQVWNAERYVYSGVDDFALAREMVANNPRLRTGPRPQIG